MNPASIAPMLRALGLPDAPVPRTGVATCVDFFARDLSINLESAPEWQRWFSYLQGIDFHQRVWRELLSAGRQLSRHEVAGGTPKPFTYYTEPGTSQFRTGTSFPSSRYVLHQLLQPTPALASTASGVKFGDRNIVRAGGGRQYIVRSSAPTTIVHQQWVPGPRVR